MTRGLGLAINFSMCSFEYPTTSLGFLMQSRAFIHTIIKDRVYFAGLRPIESCILVSSSVHILSVGDMVEFPLVDNFGSMNLYCLHRFVTSLHNFLIQNPSRKIICCVDPRDSDIINGMFLIGCYMITVLNRRPDDIWDIIKTSKPFHEQASTHATLVDMWRGYQRAMQMGWASPPVQRRLPGTSPAVHIIIPDVLLAFGGDSDSGGSAAHAATLARMRCSAVLRLHDRPEDDKVFDRHGLPCITIPFESNASLPPAVVSAFCHAIQSAAAASRGPVAVARADDRCGRAAAALCALHLMGSHEFSADEAAAWLILSAPPSSAGAPAPIHYLRDVEQEMADLAGGPRTPPASPALRGGEPPPRRRARLGAAASGAPEDDALAWRRGALARAVHRLWTREREQLRRQRNPPRVRPQSEYGPPAEPVAGGGGSPLEAAVKSRLRPTEPVAGAGGVCPEQPAFTAAGPRLGFLAAEGEIQILASVETDNI